MLYLGDCLEIMPTLDCRVDMVMCDPPYGTTACKWDSIIPLAPMWLQLQRLIKPNGAIVMTASQPFTTTLIASNMKMFRQSLVWEKTRPTNVMNANKMFMKWHEDIVVFYGKLPTYNPQKTQGKAYTKTQHAQDRRGGIMEGSPEIEGYKYDNKGWFHPKSVIKIATEMHTSVHPTQKPVALMEYLIKTYTNEGETVLDFAMGSGTTGVACRNLGRKFIGIEKDEKYFEIAKGRIEEKRLF